MNFTIGSLELNKNAQGHLGGMNPVNPVNINEKAESTYSVENSKGSFESFLMDAISEMNSQQVKVSALQEQVITDPDSVDIHDVTTAMAKAQMSMNLAQGVIDRLVKGWTELSQNR